MFPLISYVPNSEKGQLKIFEYILKHLAGMDITPDYDCICAGNRNLTFGATRDSLGGKAILKRKAIF